MFSDYDTEVVGFSSVSHEKSDVLETATQTQELSLHEQESQAKESKDVDTQTTGYGEGDRTVSYDEEKLAAFLSKIEVLVEEELDFQVDFSDLDKEDEDIESSLTRVAIFPSKDAERKVSCISWNCTGGTLAVGFGVIRHDAWCNHDSRIELHLTSLSKPTAPRVFPVASCVTCIVFHPFLPSVLFAGLYNGEVIVWDLRKDNWSAEESTSKEQNCVVHGGWCDDTSFYSATSGGSILLKKISFTNKTITTIEKFFISRGSFDSKFSSGGERVEIMAGGQLNSLNLVVGVGGGGLVQCLISPLQPPSNKPGYKDPVVQLYEPHKAVITAIKAEWNSKNFLTSSTDGQIRFYKVMEPEPKFIINAKDGLLGAFFTNNINVFGFFGGEHYIGFTKTTGQDLGIKLELSDKNHVVVAESAPKRELVAIGDASGNVEIWRVSISKQTG